MHNQGIGSWPARRARKTPHRTALIHDDRAVTYAQLDDRVNRLAQVLRRRGIRRGDRVAYLGPNHPAYLETLFAAGLIGAVFVPLNTRLTAPELRHQLDDSGSSLVLTARSAQTAQLADLDDAVEVLRAEGDEYEAMLAAATPEHQDETVGPDDLCLIMYTSGTTGRPKGAMLSHRNLEQMTLGYYADVDGVRLDGRLLHAAPMSHGSGLYNFTHLARGAAQVIPESGAFDPDEVLALFEAHRQVSLFAAPTMVQRLVERARASGAPATGLRTLVYGGGPMYVAHALDALEVLGPRLADQDPETCARLGRQAMDHVFGAAGL